VDFAGTGVAMPGDDVIEVDASLGEMVKSNAGGCRLELVNLDRAGNLKQLVLYSNKLTALPDVFGQLTGLKTLWLSDNQLTALPDAFGLLAGLKELYLAGNQLTALPDAFCQLTSLETLYLFNNKLTALPSTFGQLAGLKELCLRFNQLTALPDAFGQLTSLKTLNLQNNQLTALPDAFGLLTSLEKLELCANQLTALPDAFCQLTSLETLYLQKNQLTALPDAFGQLTGLKELWLDGNPLTSPSLEVCTNGVAAIREYFRALPVLQVDRRVTGQVDLLSQQIAREGGTQNEAGAGMMEPSQPPAECMIAGMAAPAAGLPTGGEGSERTGQITAGDQTEVEKAVHTSKGKKRHRSEKSTLVDRKKWRWRSRRSVTRRH
jgi:hypothetical protein